MSCVDSIQCRVLVSDWPQLPIGTVGRVGLQNGRIWSNGNGIGLVLSVFASQPKAAQRCKVSSWGLKRCTFLNNGCVVSCSIPNPVRPLLQPTLDTTIQHLQCWLPLYKNLKQYNNLKVFEHTLSAVHFGEEVSSWVLSQDWWFSSVASTET